MKNTWVGINQAKTVIQLYNKKIKTPEKNKIKQDAREDKMDFQCSQIGIINTARMVALPKAIYKFSQIPIKILMTLSQK